MHGMEVCYHHGGAAPQTREATRRRLLEAADPVAAALIKIALSGESEAARVSACRDVLDRAGLKTPDVLDVTVHEGDGAFEREYRRLLDGFATNENKHAEA